MLREGAGWCPWPAAAAAAGEDSCLALRRGNSQRTRQKLPAGLSVRSVISPPKLRNTPKISAAAVGHGLPRAQLAALTALAASLPLVLSGRCLA